LGPTTISIESAISEYSFSRFGRLAILAVSTKSCLLCGFPQTRIGT